MIFGQKIGYFAIAQDTLLEAAEAHGFAVEDQNQFLTATYETLADLPEDADWDSTLLETLIKLQ